MHRGHRALFSEDRIQVEYYGEITRQMVGRVLRKRGVVAREGDGFRLPGFEHLSRDQVRQLRAACETKLSEYIAKRGDQIWQHRRKSAGYVSGTLRYEVLKGARFRCELCGASADEKALEVDHIVPRERGGTDDPTNLQALWYSCSIGLSHSSFVTSNRFRRTIY